jgi:RND superfamily putative drug exporter
MVLALLILPLFALHVTPSSLTAIPKNLESEKALSIVTNSAGSGSITPSEIVIDLGSPGEAAKVEKARIELASHISSDPEIFLVASGSNSPYVDASGRYLRIYVVGKNDVGSSKTHELVNRLRTKYLKSTSFPASTQFYLAGAPAQGVDLLHRIFAALPWIVALILILTFSLLYRAFRSILLPIKALLLDLISVAVSLAAVVLVVHFGFGSSLLGTYHLRDIEAWVLIFLFAVLFGLSMDYEVFIVSRMREAWDRGSSNEEAIIAGMVETGGVVTAAAAILVVAVSGLAFGHFAGLQQLGIGLAVGIFIDATVIRGLLLPSAMVLLGKWNWYRPSK